MLRPAVSVVVAVVLVGAGTAALTATEPQRAAAELESEIDRLEGEAAELAGSSTAVRRIEHAARTPVTVTVPGKGIDSSGIGDSGIEQLRIGCPVSVPVRECPAGQASYRLSTGESRTVPVGGLRIRTDGEPLVLEPGTHRMVLHLVRIEKAGGAGFTEDTADSPGTAVVLLQRRSDEVGNASAR